MVKALSLHTLNGWPQFSRLDVTTLPAWTRMPSAPLRACTFRNCPALVRDGSRCPAHVRPAWDRTDNESTRLRGGKLQKARAALFTREPLCRVCRDKGIAKAATIRDHITPLAEGGLETESNVQPICAACHREKTAREAQRGKQRAKGISR